MVRPPSLERFASKNYKGLTIELKVKYLFLTFSLNTKFHIYQLPWGLRIRNLSSRGIKMQKNFQTKANIF